MNHLLDLNQTQVGWSTLSGVLLPLLIAFVLQAHWPRSVKTVTSIVIYGVDGLIVAAAAGQLDSSTWIQAAVIAFVTGAVAHRSVWEPTGVTDSIEVKTTVGDTKPARKR